MWFNIWIFIKNNIYIVILCKCIFEYTLVHGKMVNKGVNSSFVY